MEKLNSILQDLARTICGMDEKLDKLLERAIVPASEREIELYNIIPLELQTSEDVIAIIDKAIGRGLMEIKGKRLLWKEKATLLSYFCGRVWSGDDSVCDDTGIYHWHPGTCQFPAAALERLFDKKLIKQVRYKNLWGNPPKGFEVIDEIVTTQYTNSIPKEI